MAEYLVPVVTFLCLIGAAFAGAALNIRLPTRHVAEDTVEVVRLAVNNAVLLTSVVIALILGSAKTTLETNTRNDHALATEIIVLDRSLRTLGPEADAARRSLVEYLEVVLRKPGGYEADPDAEAALDKAGLGLRAIRVTDPQKLAVWNDAREIYRQVVRDRWITIDAAGGTIPAPLTVTLIAWLTLIFAGAGFRAPRNPVATTTLVASALMLSSALYLILEMDRPASGLIQISNAPFERALAQLQR